jgi:cell division protein FtsL
MSIAFLEVFILAIVAGMFLVVIGVLAYMILHIYRLTRKVRDMEAQLKQMAEPGSGDGSMGEGSTGDG